MAKRKSENWFYITVDGLVSGKLTPLQLRLAYKESIRQSRVIPEGIKDLVLQQVDSHFQALSAVIAALEVTAKRFEYAGRKDAKKEANLAREK